MLAAGVAVVGSRTLLDEVAAAVATELDLDGAVMAAMAAADSVCSPLLPHLSNLFAPSEVLWDLVLATTDTTGAPRYARLACFMPGWPASAEPTGRSCTPTNWFRTPSRS